MEKKYCLCCGKELTVVRKAGRKKDFCDRNCANRYHNAIHRSFYKNNRPVKTPPRGKKPKLSLAEVNALARAEGMSYGEYLMRHGY